MSVIQFLGILAAGVAGLVGFIKGVEFLFAKASRAATKWLEKGLEPVSKKLDAIDRKVAANQLENDKTILVRLLADIKNEEPLTEIEVERLHETYTRYTNAGGKLLYTY